MAVTLKQIRETVVNEAIERATHESLFLFVYEYKSTFFDYQTIWATLVEGEQPPENSRLLCTLNQDGHVDWKIDDPATLPPLSEIQLPIARASRLSTAI